MKDTRRAWGLVALLAATATASYLCRVNLSVAGLLVSREFGLPQPAMGRLFSAFLLGYMLCQVPGGMLADRFGARRVLAAAAFWWVAGTAALASVGSGALAVAAMLCLRFLIGVGEAPMFPSSAQAVSRWFPRAQQARANGLVVAAIGLGSAIAPPLVTAVMTRWGWRTALLVSAAPALAVALAWLAVHEPPSLPAEKSLEPLPPAARPLASRGFVLLTASYTLQGYVGYIFVFWFYLYLIEVRHFDLLRGALLASLPWVLSIVSIPLGGLIFDKLGASRLVPLAGLAGAGLFLAVGAHTANAYAAAACMALSTALVLSGEGPYWTTATTLSGSRAGAGGGVMNMGCNIGGLISPALTPLLAQSIGWENALHVAAVLALAAGALWLWINPRPGAFAA